MGNRKQLFLAVTVSALLGATTWAQAPYGNGMYDDSTRYNSKVEPRRGSVSNDSTVRYNSNVESRRDSMSNDPTTYGKGVTASDQKNNKSDVNITQRIRKEVMAKKGMSINAQNVKIITIDGKVTLRGNVNSANEKKFIGRIAASVASIENVMNELQVK